MLPKQRYKQEQRLLNADAIVNTHPQRQLLIQQLQRAVSGATGTVKRNCNSQSTEEGFDEEFTSFSEDDELLILPLGPNGDVTALLASQVGLKFKR